jgi:D-aminoacyl-tRNA deacylase
MEHTKVRLVVQRVKEARVTVHDEIVGKIGKGLLIFLGVGTEDTEADVDYLAEKVLRLRIFPDSQGKFNLSLEETGGSVLVVSQFTLWGDCRKGRRPSFSNSAAPSVAEPFYELFIEKIRRKGITTASGRFQEMMEVQLINDGPVTLLLDSKKTF